MGIEPTTFGLEVQRAILCATGTHARCNNKNKYKLKPLLKIQDVKVCSAFIWLRVRTSSRLTVNERFHSMKLTNLARACLSA